MKLEVGMYVRTDNGQIAKNHGEFYEPSVNIGLGILEEVNGIWIDNKCINYIDKKYIVKASHNIIDLIEAGDYVNGNEIEQILNNKLWFDASDMRECCIEPNQIESIVTKEKFESMKYNVGGN